MEQFKHDKYKTIMLINSLVEKNLNNILKQYSYTGKINDSENIKSVVNLTINSILDNDFIVNNLTNLIKLNSEIVDHSIRVSILSIIIGFKNKLNMKSIEHLCMAGVLHDIGKAQIFNKYPKLASEDYEYTRNDKLLIQSHPIIAFNELSKSKIPMPVLRAILLHHVWINPEASYSKTDKLYLSYPMFFNGKKIENTNDKDDVLGILKVVDYFDAIKTKFNSSEIALKNIELLKEKRFGNYSNLIQEVISPYSIGTEVVLSNKSKGKVVKQTSNPKKPIVETVNGSLLDLSFSNSIGIVKVSV